MNVTVEISRMIAECSIEELTEAKQTIINAIEQKQSDRFYQLVEEVLNAIKALQKEFPFAQCIVEHTNSEDLDEEIDFLDFDLSKRNFTR